MVVESLGLRFIGTPETTEEYEKTRALRDTKKEREFNETYGEYVARFVLPPVGSAPDAVGLVAEEIRRGVWDEKNPYRMKILEYLGNVLPKDVSPEEALSALVGKAEKLVEEERSGAPGVP